MQSILSKFKRTTSSGKFIPQLDGLRFVAIISVLLYHTNGALQKKFLKIEDPQTDFYLDISNSIFHLGSFGVPLFFCISGYILSQPLWNKEKFFFKEYITRRISRIEPPFVITTIIFGLAVFLKKEMPTAEFVKEFLTTLFYVHNIVVPAYNSKINGVTWSLELEVQFYLIIPFIIIYIRQKQRALVIMIAALIFFFFLNLFLSDNVKLLNDVINYFLVGIIVSYIKEKTTFRKTFFYFPGANLLLFAALFFIHSLSDYSPLFPLLNYFVLFCLFYNILIINRGVKFLASEPVSYTGGMCYTIYLIHFPMVSFLVSKTFSVLPPTFFTYIFILAFTVSITVVICAIAFLIIEKPFMKRGWYLPITKFVNR